jgi:peptidase C39-like protein
MPIHEDLTVPYHQQDTDYYCGGACAQMVLAQIGAGLLNQDDLYTENHSHSVIEGGWSTAPDGLQFTMNDRTPPGNPTSLPHGHPWFALDAELTEDIISRKIVWTIHNWRVAPIAMVYHSQHWIVVRGYTASSAPKGYSDNTYSISGFDINNPWPPTPSWYNPSVAPPPPHGAADGCGTGGNRGIADEHISYSAWHDTYMTGIDFGHWLGRFVAICDPDPPPNKAGARGFVQERLTSGENLVAPRDAAKYAIQGLASYGLDRRKNFRETLKRGKPADPVLVQRLDYLDKFYYIVPVRDNSQTASMAIIVDALSGVYRQAAISSSERSGVFVHNDRDSALEAVVGRTFELPSRLGRLRVRHEALCHYPHLVWKPCRESLTPYYPFHMFTVGDQRIYVRTDGVVFTQLHDTDHGI